MTANTVRLHRGLRAPPERRYRFVLDADARARWLPLEYVIDCRHQTRPRVSRTPMRCG